MDGRKSYVEIAQETGLTRQVVKKNYEAMEKAGIINGATIHINYKSFGCKAVANVMLMVEPTQEEKFLERMRKNAGIYAAHRSGPSGNLDVVTALKTLHQLDEIKSEMRQDFLVSEIKTSLWTDVKEMHWNLRLTTEKNPMTETNDKSKTDDTEKPNTYPKKSYIVDEIDEKIAAELSENGRAPMSRIAKGAGISVEAAKRRYETLTRNGVLKVTIQVNPERLGYIAAAIFFADTSNEDSSSSIIQQICEIPDIISIMKSTGEYDLQIWALITDVEQLLNVQDALGKIRGIKKMDIKLIRMPSKWPTPRQYISTI